MIYINLIITAANLFKVKEKKQLLVDNTNFGILKTILLKYQNIKNAYLTGTYVTCNFVELAKLCPKLGRLNLYNAFVDVSKNEVNEISKLIGPQLVQCDLTYYNMNFVKIISKHFRKIEEFVLGICFINKIEFLTT